MSYTFALAQPADEPELRALAAHPVPGAIEVTYRREPDYFEANKTLGRDCLTMVCRDQNGHLAATASRASRPVYLDGRPTTLAYLGQLRVAPAHRGRMLVPRGFRYLHQFPQPDLCLTTIIEGNATAEKILVEKTRPGMPRYRPLARLLTKALLVHPRPNPKDLTPPESLEELLTFLNAEGKRRQFFPVLEPRDLGPDLQVEDFLMVRRNGRPIAAAGLWDQRRFKQTVVNGTWHLPMASVAFCYAPDAHTLHQLLAGLTHKARKRGLKFLMVGLCEGDPLLAATRTFPHLTYASRVYLVGNQERSPAGVPHLEIACL